MVSGGPEDTLLFMVCIATYLIVLVKSQIGLLMNALSFYHEQLQDKLNTVSKLVKGGIYYKLFNLFSFLFPIMYYYYYYYVFLIIYTMFVCI